MSTIKEAAKVAGVSVATVSRVLNNSDKVKPETASRVREIIEEMGYIPNLSARNLRRHESRVVLVLAPNYTNPFYAEILQGISDRARDLEYSALVCVTGNDERHLEEHLGLLETGRADGVICLNCNYDYEWSDRFKQYPLVQCVEFAATPDVPRVSIDNYQAAYEAVSYLGSLGHRRIGMISSTNHFASTMNRLKGYKDALRDAGIESEDSLIACADDEYTYDSGFAAAGELLSKKNPPTALFCVSDLLAISAIRKAGELGLCVPEDLMVIGFDDLVYAKIFHPYLTTVLQPRYEMGYESMQLLHQLIMKEGEVREMCLLPHTLKIRESTAQKHEGGNDGRAVVI